KYPAKVDCNHVLVSVQPPIRPSLVHTQVCGNSNFRATRMSYLWTRGFWMACEPSVRLVLLGMIVFSLPAKLTELYHRSSRLTIPDFGYLQRPDYTRICIYAPFFHLAEVVVFPQCLLDRETVLSPVVGSVPSLLEPTGRSVRITKKPHTYPVVRVSY
ncbi:hypothetical protein RSAG8_11986, partial [Rhizoctonia solani AG-8 WAC10335]